MAYKDITEEMKKWREEMCGCETEEEVEIKFKIFNRNKRNEKELWTELGGLKLDEDYISFTESEEADEMMNKYEEDLIKVLSGLESELPDWYGLDEDEE